MQAFHQQAGSRGLPHSVSAGLGFHPSLPPCPPRSTLLGVAVAKELLEPVGVLRDLRLVEEVLLGLRVVVVVLVVISSLVCGKEKGMDAWRSYSCYKATSVCGCPQPWPCHRCWRCWLLPGCSGCGDTGALPFGGGGPCRHGYEARVAATRSGRGRVSRRGFLCLTALIPSTSAAGRGRAASL